MLQAITPVIPHLAHQVAPLPSQPTNQLAPTLALLDVAPVNLSPSLPDTHLSTMEHLGDLRPPTTEHSAPPPWHTTSTFPEIDT
ncbi:hypothetical protein BHE74_00021073 [Ensete ventricosum]|nr:hypothetical protein BHE74_00021073 [Ensete ventricosum]RZR92131.1 hypothetical protein BHM03_00020384 [Ensete ventricosum]